MSSNEQEKWYQKSVEEVAEETDADTGLSSSEANKRIEEYGKNTLSESESESKLKRFFKQFNNFIIYILIASAIVTLVMGRFIDTGVIVVVIFANALIGFFQENKAEQALQSIQEMLTVEATVVRDSERFDIESEDLVPGDVVYLEAGDSVPADLRLIDASNLHIQESSLTGESESVEKQVEELSADTVLAERSNMAFSSTNVTRGNGLGLVVETGDRTQIGEIGQSVSSVESQRSPMMEQADKVGKFNSVSIIALAIILFFFALFFRDYSLNELSLATITMVVGTIPEGLPAIMSMAMAIGVQRMANNNAIVKSLPAVETLGSVNVINTDKTGTLTKNEMTVQNIYTKNNSFTVNGTGYAPDGQIQLDTEDQEVDVDDYPELKQLIYSGEIANDATLAQEDGEWEINGEPTDACFLTLSKKKNKETPPYEVIDSIPFDNEYNYVAKLIEWEDKGRYIYVKGAPDEMYDFASNESFDKNEWKNKMSELTEKGQRVIGVGYKEVSSDKTELNNEDVESGFHFLGLAGIIDPPREDVIDSIKEAHQAGVTVKMITGDHPDTAKAIGGEIGLSEGQEVITGSELSQMTDENVADAIEKHNVFARMSPENKLQIIDAMQNKGLTVSMTGDGVNDAPALKKADMGVSMGIKGTETAKEASHMVLTDDDFGTIVDAVKEGRRVYANIEKSIDFLLPTSYGLGLLIFISVLLGISMPLTPVQILWINMVTAITLSFAFVYEPAEEGIMEKDPRPKNIDLIDSYDMFRYAYVSIYLAGVSVLAFYWMVNNGFDTVTASTVTVNIIAIADIFYVFNIRSQDNFALGKGFFNNNVAFIVVFVLIGLQLALTYLPIFNTIFSTNPLPWQLWLIPIGAGCFYSSSLK